MPDTRKMLAFDEGYELKVYPCPAGHPSVGIGHNLDADPALAILHKRLRLGDTITQQQVEQLYAYDFSHIKQGLISNIPSYELLLDKYKTVLINMTWNMGINGVLHFKNMLKNMRLNNDELVIAAIRDSNYYRQLPQRAERMIAIISGHTPKEYQ